MAHGGRLQHQRHWVHQAHESRVRTKPVVLRVLGITLLTIIALHILIVIVPYILTGISGGGQVESAFRGLPLALGIITFFLWLLLIGLGKPLVLLLTIGVCISLERSWSQVTLAERMAWGLILGLGLGLVLLLVSPLGQRMTHYT